MIIRSESSFQNLYLPKKNNTSYLNKILYKFLATLLKMKRSRRKIKYQRLIHASKFVKMYSKHLNNLNFLTEIILFFLSYKSFAFFHIFESTDSFSIAMIFFGILLMVINKRGVTWKIFKRKNMLKSSLIGINCQIVINKFVTLLSNETSSNINILQIKKLNMKWWISSWAWIRMKMLPLVRPTRLYWISLFLKEFHFDLPPFPTFYIQNITNKLCTVNDN